MRKSTMRKLVTGCIAAFALVGGIGVANAEMHGGAQAGAGGFHGSGSLHGSAGFHGGGGFHGGVGFHGRSHGSVFIGAPIIFGPSYYPYGYAYPYGDAPLAYGDPDAADFEPQDSASNYWYYCRNPAGYYPDVPTCPSGWLQVIPNG